MDALGANHLAFISGLAIVGLTASVAFDRLVRPGGPGFVRPLPAIAIHAGMFFALWSLLWVIGARPGFAAALTLAGQGLVVAVSNAKYRALREPFIFSDLVLFSQVFRFPRLYLPFLGIVRAGGAAASVGGAIAVGLLIESPWPGGTGWAGALLVAGLALLALGSHAALPPSLDPVGDLKSLGLFPSLWLYGREALVTAPTPPERPWLRGAEPDPDLSLAPLPDLLLVQSESFCDARRLYPGIRPDLLPWFDALRNRSLARGRLSVPAWGANTMRTEFAVLTGIAADCLGVHRFNPYRWFARHDCLALPHRLRALGYRTLCIHPHPAEFFGRDRVFPGLGVDQFIDISGFPAASRAGPYVADAAVTAKVAEVLAVAEGPTCIFVITMENHGPLHLEQVQPGDHERLYREPPPAGWEDLTIYLRHLVNADQMFGDLADLLSARPRGGLLCVYGDHVPSMPHVYEDLSFSDPRTDYLIWSTASSGLGQQCDLAAHQLPETLLAALATVAQPRKTELSANKR